MKTRNRIEYSLPSLQVMKTQISYWTTIWLVQLLEYSITTHINKSVSFFSVKIEMLNVIVKQERILHIELSDSIREGKLIIIRTGFQISDLIHNWLLHNGEQFSIIDHTKEDWEVLWVSFFYIDLFHISSLRTSQVLSWNKNFWRKYEGKCDEKLRYCILFPPPPKKKKKKSNFFESVMNVSIRLWYFIFEKRVRFWLV